MPVTLPPEPRVDVVGSARNAAPYAGWWGELWRLGLAAASGLLALLVTAYEAEVVGRPAPDSAIWFVDVVLGLVAFAVLTQRRRHPLAVAMVVILFTAVSATSVGSGGIALISLATHRRWQPVAVAVALNVPVGIAFELLHPTSSHGVSDALITGGMTVAVIAFCVALGYYIGARRDLLTSLQERAATNERAQAARIARARSEERARIAREMHDVLAHRISLVAMHSGALAYRTDLTRHETAEAAEVIRDNAHRALGELREVLGVLRDDTPSGAPEPPQPTLAALGPLLDDVRRAGSTIQLTDRTEALEQLPEATSRAAYRIVQESLTNAAKHAPGSVARLELTGAAGATVEVVVRNRLDSSAPDGGSAPASGLGLLGLRERAELLGGTLEFGPDRGEFVIRAELPWPLPDRTPAVQETP